MTRIEDDPLGLFLDLLFEVRVCETKVVTGFLTLLPVKVDFGVENLVVAFRY